MRDARRGRRSAAPFRVRLLLASVLVACGPFAPHADPDQIAAVIGGARVQLTPQATLAAGNGVKVALALERVSDRPITRDLRIRVSDVAGAALDDASVVVIAEMPGMRDAPIQSQARPDGPGWYVARVVFPMGGAYAVQVIVTGYGELGILRLEVDIAS
jgi:hypothetical protein